MKDSASPGEFVPINLGNRIFHRLYQCANLMHKTGTKAVEDYGVTTQQWAVLGALSGDRTSQGITVGELAEFLLVSRQNLAGVLTRLEKQGYIERVRDLKDARSRSVRLTPKGRHIWDAALTPKIWEYYDKALHGIPVNDQASILHYFNKLLDNMIEIEKSNGS